MRAKLVNLYDCAVPFLSRAAVNLYWYYITYYIAYRDINKQTSFVVYMLLSFVV